MEILGWKINLEKTKPNASFLEQIEEAVESGGWEAAKEVCRNTKGKAAGVAYQMIELFQKHK